MARLGVLCPNNDLHFQGNKFWNVNISKMVRDSKKAHMCLIAYQTFQWLFGRMQTSLLPLDIKPGICQRMTPRLMLYVVTSTYIFKSRILNWLISQKRWELAKKYSITAFIMVDIGHRMRSLWMLYCITLTKIFKVRHFFYGFSFKNNCAFSGYPW